MYKPNKDEKVAIQGLLELKSLERRNHVVMFNKFKTLIDDIISNKINKNTWVLIDIDNTLLKTVEWGNRLHWTYTDRKVLNFMNLLKEMKIDHMGFTSRITGNLTYEDKKCYIDNFGVNIPGKTFEEYSYLTLKEKGIEFPKTYKSRGSIEYEQLTLKKIEDRSLAINQEMLNKYGYRHPMFYKGILFTSNVEKINVLSEFIKNLKMPKKYKKIIIIDDDITVLEPFLNITNIHVECYYYS